MGKEKEQRPVKPYKSFPCLTSPVSDPQILLSSAMCSLWSPHSSRRKQARKRTTRYDQAKAFTGRQGVGLVQISYMCSTAATQPQSGGKTLSAGQRLTSRLSEPLTQTDGSMHMHVCRSGEAREEDDMKKAQNSTFTEMVSSKNVPTKELPKNYKTKDKCILRLNIVAKQHVK